MNLKHIPRFAALTMITASLLVSYVSAAETNVKFSTGSIKNITDLVLLKSMTLGETESDAEADINSDGTVNSEDAVILADYLLKHGNVKHIDRGNKSQDSGCH